MSCNRTNRYEEPEMSIISNRSGPLRNDNGNTTSNRNYAGNCSDIYTNGSCGNVISPVGLPFDPCRGRERDRGGDNAEYAYYSTVNSVLNSGAPFPLQRETESGDDIVSNGNGTIELQRGVFLIAYGFSGAVSEKSKAFIARPYINGTAMDAESTSLYGAEIGTQISGSRTFILRVSSGTELYFKADGTQMLTGASFTVGIVKIR